MNYANSIRLAQNATNKESYVILKPNKEGLSVKQTKANLGLNLEKY